MIAFPFVIILITLLVLILAIESTHHVRAVRVEVKNHTRRIKR